MLWRDGMRAMKTFCSGRFSLSLFAVSVLVSCGLISSPAWAQSIGKAVSAVPSATYSEGAAPQTIEVGTEFEQNDRIVTDKNGAAEIEFADGTSLTIGANSEVVLDKMIFDGDKARNATVNVVRGTLRFVTGSSDHSAYQIKTPVATIGVRGTVIDISLEKDDMVFNTVEGIGVVCRGGNDCRDIRAGDKAIAVSRMGFRLATVAQTARLTRVVTGAHTHLSRRIGRDPRMGKGFQKRMNNLDKKGLDRQGLDKKGLDKKGLDKKGLDKKGLDKKGFDKKGLDKKGLDQKGLDKKGLDKRGGLDRQNLDRHNASKNDLGKNLEKGADRNPGKQFDRRGGLDGKRGMDRPGGNRIGDAAKNLKQRHDGKRSLNQRVKEHFNPRIKLPF